MENGRVHTAGKSFRPLVTSCNFPAGGDCYNKDTVCSISGFAVRSTNVPSKKQILLQRDRILASDTFRSSQRISDFLDYLVTEALGDGAPKLKEFAIGVAVFGRDETFDPRIDSVVRVEAGRLRTKLLGYYVEAGAGDPVRISVPKGGYAPQFELVEPAVPAKPADGKTRAGTPRRALLFTAAAVVAVVALVFFRQGIIDVDQTAQQSIAVLPLRDWSDNPDDYFSEAMTDVLISTLSQSADLRVTAMSSVMGYKDAILESSEIAAQLGVDRIVEGTVYRDADQVRITASLIDPAAGRNVWSNTYDKPMTNVVSLQQEVASQIAEQLLGELMPGTRISKRAIDPEAYEAFLKGIYWRNRLTPQGFNQGIVYFQQAIDRQPDYAEAYAGMAACHCRLAGHGIEVVQPGVALPFAADLAQKAIEIDDSLAEPNAVLGIIKFKYDWDAASSVQYLERALELNPSLFEAQLWYSQVAEGMGNQEFAIEMARSAYRINPLSPAANLNLGWQLYQAGRLAEAEVQFDKLIAFDPGFWGGYWGKGNVLRAREDHAGAIDAFATAMSLEGGHTVPMASLGYTYALAGEHDKALAIVDEMQAMSENIYVSPVHVATVYAGLGDAGQALDWLERGYDVRARSMAWLNARREFDGLRDKPRYQALVSSVGIGSD